MSNFEPHPPRPISAATPSRRRWFFRPAFLLFAPLLLTAAELLIRLTGWGLPDAREVMAMNPTGLPLFECSAADGGTKICRTSRFFRSFIGQQKFTMPKPAGTVRVFCLGESVTAGYPFFLPGSFARFLSIMLTGSGGRFEAINVGVQGIRSADIRQICREVMDLDPDWIVVYMGNNEFLGLDPEEERGFRADLRDGLRRRLARSRLYFAILARIDWRSANESDRQPPDLLRAAVETHQEVSRRNWDAAARAEVIRRFEENLNATIDTAEANQVRVMLATVAVNLRGFFPFRHDENWPGADGCSAPPINAPAPPLDPAALRERDQCLRDPGGPGPAPNAAEAYRRGCCALWGGNLTGARDYFLTAVERDPLPLRALPAINEIIRQTADRRGRPLADVESAFSSASVWKIPGDDLFLDHVHPDLPGAALIARVILHALAGQNAAVIDDEIPNRMHERGETYARSIPPAFLYSSYFTDAGHVVRFGCFTRAARLYRQAAAADPPGMEAIEAAERTESWARSTASELQIK